MGQSQTRGGFTSVDFPIPRPAAFISSISGEKGALVWFISPRKFQVAKLQTNSPVDSQFVTVSFTPWGWRPLLANITIGGSLATPLKKLYGARLTTPSLSTVLTHPIGLGTMQLLNGSWGSPWSLVAVS
tara:strand:+ start:70 stop:456 length:387 start_codon:yes stop_codon:yes gene_type:complete